MDLNARYRERCPEVDGEARADIGCTVIGHDEGGAARVVPIQSRNLPIEDEGIVRVASGRQSGVAVVARCADTKRGAIETTWSCCRGRRSLGARVEADAALRRRTKGLTCQRTSQEDGRPPPHLRE